MFDDVTLSHLVLLAYFGSILYLLIKALITWSD